MKIQKKLRADLVGMKTSPNKDTAGKTTTAVLRIEVKADEAAKMLGDTFNKLAFGPMITQPGEDPVFPYSSIKPDLVVEKHMVTLIDHGPIPVSPILTSIHPVKGKEAVHITLELPMAIEKKTFAADIWAEIGEVVDVEFEPSQMMLPLGEGEAEAPEARGVKRNKAGPFGNGQQVLEQ